MSTKAEIDAAIAEHYRRKVPMPLFDNCWMLSGLALALNRKHLTTQRGNRWTGARVSSYLYPSRRAIHGSIRKARLKAAGGSHTESEWLAVCEAHGNRCATCGNAGPLQKDHIVQVYRGGSDDISNIRPLCQRCNCSRGPQMTARPEARSAIARKGAEARWKEKP